MKIKCSLLESAQMITNCEHYRKTRACEGCVLLGCGFCGPDGEENVKSGIEFEIIDRFDFEKIVTN